MKIQQKISPCLWFDMQAEEAMKFYVEVFNGSPHSAKTSKILSIMRYVEGMETPGMPQMKGKVLTGEFQLEGQRFFCLDGGPIFKLNESLSLYIECEDQAEVDYFFKRLSAVPESEICGWCKDKFGLSWQVVPARLGQLMSGSDLEVAKNVMNALLKMKKIDIAGLEKAASARPAGVR